MRITILGVNFSPERTGVAPYTTGLARHLSRQHEVTVVTGLPHYPEWRVAPGVARRRAEEQHGDVRVIRVPHHVPSKPGVVGRGAFEVTWAARGVQAARQIPADLVLAVIPNLLGAAAGVRVARRVGAPLGVIVQDIMGAAAQQSGMAGGSAVSRITTLIERVSLARAAGVVTIHPRLAEELTDLCAVKPTVVYNWTHVTSRPNPGRSHRESLGWRDDEVIALHSGNMGAKQNLEVVIDAARVAAVDDRPVRFVLAGGGNQRARLEKYAQRCPNVSFLPGVDDADYMDFLASADVLLVNERPGMREMSLPSKLTSYLIAGRPIVAATDDDSATAEFVRASGGGVVTTAGDHEALLRVVESVAADATISSRLAATGREFAEEHLSETAALQAYDDWIDDISCGAPPS